MSMTVHGLAVVRTSPVTSPMTLPVIDVPGPVG